MSARRTRRAFLAAVGSLSGPLAGCSDAVENEPTEPSTTTPTSTPEPWEPTFRDARALIEGEQGEQAAQEFEDRLIEDGDYTETGRAFLQKLEDVREIGKKQFYGTATSIVHLDELSEDDVDTLDWWLNTDTSAQFQNTVFEYGLADSDGDGLRDGLEQYLDTETDGEEPEVAELVSNLKTPEDKEGFTERDLAYLNTVSDFGEVKNNGYKYWHQAEALGLLHEATENGHVTDEILQALDTGPPGDLLLRGVHKQLGTDPTSVDTSGDGIPDHLKWLIKNEISEMDAHLTEPDIYVEVDTASGAQSLTDQEKQMVKQLFRDTPEDVPPIHVHFFESDVDVEPVDEEEWDSYKTGRVRNFDRQDLGYRHVLINDTVILDDESELRGIENSGIIAVNGNMTRGKTMASVVAHEIGHSLGLGSEQFEGVDSREYPLYEYHSVMNYNGSGKILAFNDGEPFDDWDRMREARYGYYDINIFGIKERWEQGPSTDRNVWADHVDPVV